MKNIVENNIVRFISITKRKEGLFANFKVKGIRNGVAFAASIAVDVAEAATLDIASASLESIVAECAKIAVREFKKTELQFEGITVL